MLGHPSSILDWQSGGLFVGGILWNLISRDLQKWMHITTVSSVFQLKDTGIDTETVRSQGALFFFFLTQRGQVCLVALTLTTCWFCECNTSKLWFAITEVKPSYFMIKLTLTYTAHMMWV